VTHEPKVISGPVKEPVSATEAKLACKVDHAVEDSLFDIWIAAARDYFETHSARTVHEKTLEVTLDRWPCCGYIVLPRATPLISITSVIYTNSVAVPATWSSLEYIADVDSRVGRLVLGDGQEFPTAELYPANGIRIRYKAGIATTSPESEAPGFIKYPVLLLVAGMYENRESEVMDRSAIASIALRYGVDAWIERARVESNVG
jgi:uncharacterized phiE125 gp8 family phage protein